MDSTTVKIILMVALIGAIVAALYAPRLRDMVHRRLRKAIPPWRQPDGEPHRTNAAKSRAASEPSQE